MCGARQRDVNLFQRTPVGRGADVLAGPTPTNVRCCLREARTPADKAWPSTLPVCRCPGSMYPVLMASRSVSGCRVISVILQLNVRSPRQTAVVRWFIMTPTTLCLNSDLVSSGITSICCGFVEQKIQQVVQQIHNKLWTTNRSNGVCA